MKVLTRNYGNKMSNSYVHPITYETTNIILDESILNTLNVNHPLLPSKLLTEQKILGFRTDIYFDTKFTPKNVRLFDFTLTIFLTKTIIPPCFKDIDLKAFKTIYIQINYQDMFDEDIINRIQELNHNDIRLYCNRNYHRHNFLISMSNINGFKTILINHPNECLKCESKIFNCFLISNYIIDALDVYDYFANFKKSMKKGFNDFGDFVIIIFSSWNLKYLYEKLKYNYSKKENNEYLSSLIELEYLKFTERFGL